MEITSLICSSCGTENKAGRRFCVRCATPLSAACPNCGTPYDPGDAFCGECAAPLHQPAATARPSGISGNVSLPGQPATAERRLVSTLFADLVGFTPFAEERDAEDVRETLTRYFALATEIIERYGGTVEKFIGDAVMAVWGAPTAREDDAERCVRAALDLVDAVRTLGPAIQARAGVLTGEAAVTIGAANQGLVAGDIVNTAARLQSVAPPGTVLVGESTMRAASAAIAFEEAGAQVLKGKAAPVPAFRALRVVAQRRGEGRSDLPEPPFVGRDEELRLLKDLIATTGRDRRARLVAITGPGGIGKSRLAWELEKYIDGITEDIYWHRGRSPSYGEGIAFWALGEMVRRRAGLAEGDDESATRERLRATVAEFVPSDGDRRWVEPALLTLLGLEPPPPGGRDVLFAAWRIFFERIAERGTTVLLFEDLQWADSGLLEFIGHLLEWSRGVPLIVIALARPEFLERHPDWGTQTRNLTRLALEPLSDAAMRELLAGFAPGLPDDAVRAILQRADGMPLYAVETVRSLVTDGRLERHGDGYRPVGDLGVLAVPDSLRSLIASRLDGLDPAERNLVADASILGQTFGLAALASVSGQPPDVLEPRVKSLVRRELFDVEVDPRSPERGQYRFVQSLIREVAYGTLGKRERRARHLAAARYFEALGDDELAGVLASHYLAAHQASADGAEAEAVAIQARLALSGAAERAASLGAHEQAIAYLRQAVTIIADPAERAHLLLRAATSADVAAGYTEAEELARQAVDLARSVGDSATAGAGEALVGEVLIDASQVTEAASYLEGAVERNRAEAGETRASLLGNLSRAYMRSGRFTEAVAAADEALPLAERQHLDRILAETLNNKGSALSYLGRQIEGAALLRAAVDLAHDRGFVAAEIRALQNLSASGDDDFAGAAKTLETAVALARRVGNRNLATWADVSRLFIAVFLLQDWDAALSDVEQLLADGHVRVHATPLDQIRMLLVKGLILGCRGESTDDVISAAEAQATRTSDTFAAAAIGLLRGERAIFAGDDAAATAEYLSAGDESNIGDLLLARAGRAALRTGDVRAAADVADRFDAIPSTGRRVSADRRALRAGIAAAEGRREEAAAGYREALALHRGTGNEFDRALIALDFLALVGPGDAAARAAADEARAMLTRVGARAWLARFEELTATSGRRAGPSTAEDRATSTARA